MSNIIESPFKGTDLFNLTLDTSNNMRLGSYSLMTDDQKRANMCHWFTLSTTIQNKIYDPKPVTTMLEFTDVTPFLMKSTDADVTTAEAMDLVHQWAPMIDELLPPEPVSQ